MSVVGTRVLRKEDPGFLSAGAVYAADLDEPLLTGAKYVTYVRSTMAHAEILSVDTTDAAAMPGVVAVFTAADLDDNVAITPGMVPMFPEPMMLRPTLATGRVRFAGEPVAVIITDLPQQGEDAAEAVFIDYEPLVAVVDMEAAKTDATVIYPEVGTNTAIDFVAFGMATGITDDFFADCEVTISQRVVNQRTAACPLEVRSACVAWSEGDIHMWLSTQAPHGVSGAVAKAYEVPVHLKCPDVGGGFGAKIAPYPEELLLPWLAQKVGTPVRWFENRTENMTAMGPGRAHTHVITLGGTRDGDVTHARLEMLADSGAYARMGAFLPFFTHQMASGTYAIPNIETAASAVITNTTPTEAYRGAGRPEATVSIERGMDVFAAEIGMDPIDVRRKNFITPEQMPYDTGLGTTYDSGRYELSMDMALDAAGYADLRAEQQRRLDAGDTKLLGIGVASYVEITAGPAPGGSEFGKVEILPDGTAKAYSGSFSHGQGHKTTFAQIVADQLGMAVDDVVIVQGDTDLIPHGHGTYASRSTQIGGSAVHNAAKLVVDKARQLAADSLEASVDDVVLDVDAGVFHVAGTPSVSRSWADIAAVADGPLDAETDFDGGCTFPFGAHVAVVEVDVDTGEVTVSRMVTCDDSGNLVNPMIVEGQRHGGIAQGVAQALLEEVRYDEDGNPVTSNFLDYGIISMAELPSFELVTLETPTPQNPLGVKGIGESGAIGSTPAVQSAVIDAVKHLGVRHIDIPCTPEKVWRAMHSAT